MIVQLNELFSNCLKAETHDVPNGIALDPNSDLKVSMVWDAETALLTFYFAQTIGDFPWSSDWRRNFDMKLVSAPFLWTDRRSKVHDGWLREYVNVRQSIWSTVTNKLPQKILIVGFSQGGAEAHYLMKELMFLTKIPITLVTFGCPRPFNSSAAWEFKAALVRKPSCKVFRFVNYKDLVSQLPSRIFGYRHACKRVVLGGPSWWLLFRLKAHFPQEYLNAIGTRTLDV